MATTAQDIIDRALMRWKGFQPGVSATDSELLLDVGYALAAMYAVAARVNPYFFGDSKVVAYSAPGWARPADAESVFRIERDSGEEVVVVPIDDKKAEAGKPSVYRWGQVYRPAGVTPGPTTDESLTFFYSKRAPMPATLNEDLDSAWPEHCNELLALEVAIRIGIKEGGQIAGGIVQAFSEERLRHFQRYIAFLEHEDIGERRRFALVRQFNTNTLVPVHSLLAGATAGGAA